MTTPVGSIKFDLSIDGSGLSRDILREVNGALAPMLAEFRRDLAAVERDYAHLTREAEKSGAKQTAAAKTVAEAIEDVGDEHTKTAAKARAAAGVSTRSINAQTRAWERQTAAIAANTAARLANAAAPIGGPPPAGGGRGGGGGGGDGGNHFSRGRSGSGGFFGFGGPVIGALGWNAVAGIVGSFPAAATVVTNLTGAVQELVQVGLVLPGVFAGAASSIGTAVLGFSGLSDAISAVWEAAASGDAKDLEKATEALEKLSPAAAAVATTIGKDLRTGLVDLQKLVSQNMFEGVDKTLTDLNTKALPTFEKGLGGIGTAWNRTFKQLGATLGSDRNLSLLDRVFGNTAEAQTRMNAAIEPLVHGFGTLTAAGSDFLPRIADAFTSMFTRFDKWISAADGDGRLAGWIDKGLTAVGNLGEAFLNVGKIVADLTSAAGGDGGFLKWLEDATGKLHTFLSSDEGQAKLVQFFRDGREQLARWFDILQDVGSGLVDIYNGVKQWVDALLPVVQTVTGVISAMPGGIQGVATAFLAWKTTDWFTSILGGLRNMGGLLDGIPGKAGKSAGGFAAAFNPTTLGIVALLASVTNLINTIKENNEYVKLQADPTVPQEVKDVARQEKFYPNTRLPNTAELIPEPGTLMYDTLLDDLKSGRIEYPGIDASNAEAELAKVAQQAQAARDNIDLVANGIETLPTGQVVVKDNSDEAIERVKKLGYAVQDLPNGRVEIKVVYTLNGQPIDPSQLRTPTFIPAVPGETRRPVGGGRADGGVIPGWSPGVDNVLYPLSGGEGILIPEAVRGLGGASAVYAINSMFRRGLSRRGYSDGGVVGGVAPALSPLAGDIAAGLSSVIAPVVGLLSQIVGLLGGNSAPVLADQIGTEVSDWLAPTGGTTTGDNLWRPGDHPLPGWDLRPWWTKPEAQLQATGGGGLGGAAGMVDYPRGAAVLVGGPSGSKAGLQPAAAQLWDLVAANFPQVRQIGGVRDDPIPDHPSGRALDIMVGDNLELGDRINEFLRANAAILGIDSTIWRDQWADFQGNSSTVPGHQDHIHAKTVAGEFSGVDPAMLSATAPGLPGADFATAQNPVPVYIVGGPGAVPGQGMGGDALQSLVGGAFGGAQQVAGTLIDDAGRGVLGAFPSPVSANTPRITNPEDADNLLGLLATAAGYDVADFTRQGGGEDAKDLTTNGGPGFNALGQVYSDTAALIDRTFTSLAAQLKAQQDQTMDVLTQVRDQLTQRLLLPTLKQGVSSGIDAISQSTSAAIGAAMGQAAAPPIASAVSAAVRSSSTQGQYGQATTGAIQAGAAAVGFSGGGSVFGGVPGIDSVPAMLKPGEHVLTTEDVSRMGGQRGVYAFRAALSRYGGVRGFATGGGVIANETVGAEFFGVDQLPIIGLIVNVLVRILLAVLGVQIEARDTLGEMTDEFRQFRGEFKAFDATGRLLNDTSALTERSQSSEELAAQERIRILKIVIQALIKYIIEKVIVPLAKAVANAALNFAGTAASGAISTGIGVATGGAGTAAGGLLGGLASSMITGVGGAGVDIIAEIGSAIAVETSAVLIDVLGDALLSYFPGLTTSVFGAALNPLTNLLTGAITDPILGVFGSITTGIAALIGGIFTPIAAMASFDEGGLANDIGLMPKATIQPERVLSGRQTAAFERMVEREFNTSGTSRQVTIHAPITVAGGQHAGETVRDRLLELMS